MKAIYFTVDIGQVFHDAESSYKQFFGVLLSSLTHIVTTVFMWHTCSSVAHLTFSLVAPM